MVYFGTLVTSRVDTFFHFSNSEVYVCVCVIVVSLFSNVAICHILVIHVCVTAKASRFSITSSHISLLYPPVLCVSLHTPV